MQQALLAAQSSLYITSPNPRVGCVIVHNHTQRIIATGATQAAGGPHAERVALDQARAAGYTCLKNTTIYVTLEPCSHYGRTPPCVQALIAAQPHTVVVALIDPNPKVAGQGVAALQAAGIAVVVGVEAEAALALNIGFVARMRRQRPWLWLKTASSLDGRTALDNGESKWITGAEARADGQHFRARSCLVLTGIGTVIDDNPLLNVRTLATSRQPIRAVVDSQLRICPQAAIFNGDPVWVFSTRTCPELAHELAKRQGKIIVLPATAQGQVDLSALMQYLATQQINEVHTEAGATLNGALWQAGLVDALVSYIAPCVIGPGRPIMHVAPLSQLNQSQHFDLYDQRQVGTDIRLLMRHPLHWQQLLHTLDQMPT